MTKYGHLIKPLAYRPLPGGEGKPEFITWPKGSDLEGLNLSFVWGYHNKPGPWPIGGKFGHAHPYAEVFLFTGLDYDNPNQLGAELELAIGENGEEHVIAAPSVITFPAGVSHMPMVTKKVSKPYGFLAISLDGHEQTTELASRGRAHPLVNKYGDLITRLEMRNMKRQRGGNADIFYARNGKPADGFKLHFTWAFHRGTGTWHPNDPHVHPNDEALVFVGLDPDKPDYLGAEIEIQMGEQREVHVFNKPTVVIAPKGLVHCPLITHKVEKPYAFTAICLANEHETTWLGKAPDNPM